MIGSEEMFNATRSRPGPSTVPAGTEPRPLIRIERELIYGQAFYESWENESRTSRRIEIFDLLEEYRGHSVKGLRGELPVPGLGIVPIIGAVQQIPFTRPKPLPGKEQDAARCICEEIREFAFHHFMAATWYARPEAYPQLGQLTLLHLLETFSWCPAKDEIHGGVRFFKAFYKTADGRLGEFPGDDQKNFEDLRNFGKSYDWIILRAKLFDDTLTIGLRGCGSPRLAIPTKRALHFGLSPKMVYDHESPSPGLLGSFGFRLDLVGIRQHRWEISLPAFAKMGFKVLESGEVVAETLFLGRRPNYQLPAIAGFDPITESFDLFEMLTARESAGWTPRTTQLDRSFLLKRSAELYHMVIGTLPFWNRHSHRLRPAAASSRTGEPSSGRNR